MILVILGLLALSAIYFTRYFYKRGYKIATMAITVLFVAIVVWIYFLFVFDMADFGFREIRTRESIMFGTDIYASFVNLNAILALFPTPLLYALVGVIMFTLIVSLIVIVDGFFRAAETIFKAFKTFKTVMRRPLNKLKTVSIKIIPTVQLIRLYCRANC